MSALKKLNEARKQIHASKIKKTGWNDFSKYEYFELADFLMPALAIFDSLNMSGVVSFGTELATMTITDLDDESSHVTITSPMSTANLKACHEVQNLGAVETYIRRYLWVTALEIVEHDAIDSSPGADVKKPASKTQRVATDPAQEIVDGVNKGDAAGAATYLAGLPQQKLDALWAKLPGSIQEKLTAEWPKETAS